MYELPRQLQLLKSINTSVVVVPTPKYWHLQALLPHCETMLCFKDVWTNTDLLAEAADVFGELATVVASIGELPHPQNKWLLTVAEKILFWLGPEDEIKAEWGSFEEYKGTHP